MIKDNQDYKELLEKYEKLKRENEKLIEVYDVIKMRLINKSCDKMSCIQKETAKMWAEIIDIRFPGMDKNNDI